MLELSQILEPTGRIHLGLLDRESVSKWPRIKVNLIQVTLTQIPAQTDPKTDQTTREPGIRVSSNPQNC